MGKTIHGWGTKINEGMVALDFGRQLQEFSAKYGVEVGKVLRSQMALWCLDLMDKTYPQGTGKSAQARGEAGVILGITRCIQLLGAYKATWEKNGRTFVKLDSDAVIEVDRRNFHDRIEHDPSMMSMAAWHKSQRIEGRVPKNPSKLYVGSKTARERYINEVRSHVFRTKAGWLAGADYYLAKADPMMVRGRVPPKVAAHRNWAAGYSVKSDNLPVNCDPMQTIKGNVTSGSNVPWAGRNSGILTVTMAARVQDLSHFLWLRMDKIARTQARKLASMRSA